MIQTRKLFVAGALIVTSLAFAGHDGVVLRKTLKAGTQSYHLETAGKQTITIPGQGDQDMGLTTVASYKYKIGDSDATTGLSPVELTSKVEKFDVDGPMAEIMAGQKDKLLVTTVTTGKIDPRSRYTADPGKKMDPRAVMNGSAAYSFIGPFFELPEKALSPGDTWDIVIPKGSLTGKDDQKITAKFIGEKDGAYAISISGTVKMTINMADLMKDNPVPELEAIGAVNMTVTGSTDFTGDILMDKTTCQTLSMNIKMVTKQETSLPDQNISIPSNGTSTVKITLDK